MATLKDVAKLAGVSTATVSCCLSGSRAVRPSTKAKILDAVEALKYIPNHSAQSLKGARNTEIGVILTDIEDQLFADIFKGVSSFFQSNNYNINVAFSSSLPDVECQITDEFISKSMAGLVIITCQPENVPFFESRILHYNIPTVFVQRKPKGIPCNLIAFHNQDTVYQLTTGLLRAGYQRIALLCGHSALTSEGDALHGYEQAMRQFTQPASETLCAVTNMSKEDAFRSAIHILSVQKPQAVITTTVAIAKGVMEAASVLGIQIPEHMQLVALGRENWNQSDNLHGAIHVPHSAFELGSRTGALLLENIRAPLNFQHQQQLIDCGGLGECLTFPPPPVPPSPAGTVPRRPLRILMADLNTSKAVQVVSHNFSNRYGVDLHFETLPQNKVLNRILDDMKHTSPSYDVYMYDLPWLNFLVQSTVLCDITDFVEHDVLDRNSIFPENLAHCYTRKRCYGIPIVGGTQILFYRKDLFEDSAIRKQYSEVFKNSLRPPKTWPEFNNIARFFTQKFNPASPTQYGTSFSGIFSEEMAPEIWIRLWSYEGRIFDSRNRVQLNSPQCVKAFRCLIETLQYTNPTPFQTSIYDTVREFCAGHTAMLITYSDHANSIHNALTSKALGRVGYELLPGRAHMSIGWNFGISRLSEQRELACQYFSWLCRREIGCYLTILDGQSTLKAPYRSNELNMLYPWLNLTEKSFTYCRNRSSPYDRHALAIPSGSIEEILCEALINMVIRGTPVEEALIMAQDKMEVLFQSYGYS